VGHFNRRKWDITIGANRWERLAGAIRVRSLGLIPRSPRAASAEPSPLPDAAKEVSGIVRSLTPRCPGWVAVARRHRGGGGFVGRLGRGGRHPPDPGAARPPGTPCGASGELGGGGMRDVDLFQMALGLESPWYVARTEFDAEATPARPLPRRREGGRFTCPDRGKGGCPAHDTTEQRWRHLDIFQHEAFLHARVPRMSCGACGVKLVEVPWARAEAGSRFSSRRWFWPWSRVCRWLPWPGWCARTTRGCGGSFITTSRTPERTSAMRGSAQLGVDETSLRRGHKYLTLFVNLDEARVLFSTGGWESDTHLKQRGATRPTRAP